MRLSPGAFNRHLGHMGQDFLYRKSSVCPCKDKNSGGARHNCPRCLGKGVFWADPIPATAGVASQSVIKNYANFGQWESGDALLSIPENSAMYDAGRFDRMVMLNSTDAFNLALVRGQNDKIMLPVERFERVFWLDTDGFGIVDGGLPTVSASGVLTWASGEPPAGTQYTISGTRFTEYFVWAQLASDRGEHHGARLPRRVQARRFDLFGK
jgi:hypothetical protein